MFKLNDNQKNNIKEFIFRYGRLLERKLFSFFFEDGTIADVLKTLTAYQNDDGGFGNGIEPDILCPDSTGIGAETALYILDLLEIQEDLITQNLFNWVLKSQNNQGFIRHPPDRMFEYPYQPWWKNSDDFRILSIAGFLKKLGIKNDSFFSKVRNYYNSLKLPEQFQIYDYPYYVFLKYCKQSTKDDDELLSNIIKNAILMMQENSDHHPLFGRYWYTLIDDIQENLIKTNAEFFIISIQADGAIETPYENLLWWRPIFTLDGLILLKKSQLLEW